ncbi:hypothetical protein JDW15_10105 [Aerococcaceae bacterium zg-ZJ1578]|nr:hypothetical protein [Aerococcaceae bacterium zg-1578]
MKRDVVNQRILAQKGSFFNCDRIRLMNVHDKSKINSFKIVLEFDEETYIKSIEDEIEKNPKATLYLSNENSG